MNNLKCKVKVILESLREKLKVFIRGNQDQKSSLLLCP